jgi:hypothetical protein
MISDSIQTKQTTMNSNQETLSTSTKKLENQLATLETLLVQLQTSKVGSPPEACKAVQSTIDKLRKTIAESTASIIPNEPDYVICEPVKVPEPVEQVEPVKVPEPVEQVEPVKVPEPVEQGEPVKVPEPVEQDEPVKVPIESESEWDTESDSESESDEKSEPVKVPEPVEKSEPVKVPEPVEKSEPVKVPEPVEPMVEPMVVDREHAEKMFAKILKSHHDLLENLQIKKIELEKQELSAEQIVTAERNELQEMVNCKDIRKLVEKELEELATAEQIFVRKIEIYSDKMRDEFYQFRSYSPSRSHVYFYNDEQEILFDHNIKILKLIKYLTVEQKKSIKLCKSSKLDVSELELMEKIGWKYSILFTRPGATFKFNRFINLKNGLGIMYQDLDKAIDSKSGIIGTSIDGDCEYKIIPNSGHFYEHIISYPYDTLVKIFQNTYYPRGKYINCNYIKNEMVPLLYLPSSKRDVNALLHNSLLYNYADMVKFILDVYPCCFIMSIFNDENFCENLFDYTGPKLSEMVRNYRKEHNNSLEQSK